MSDPKSSPAFPPHILRMLDLFRARWPKHPITDDTITVYAVCLMDVTPEALQVATLQLLRTAKFFPGVDEIRDLANGPIAQHASPEEAWSEVMGQVRAHGWAGKPTFSSDEIKRSVEAMGGWLNLCSQLTEAVPANRAHFMRIYGSMAKSAARELEYAGASEIVAHVSGLLGGGPKALYGADYVDPIEDADPDKPPESKEDRDLRRWEEGGDQ